METLNYFVHVMLLFIFFIMIWLLMEIIIKFWKETIRRIRNNTQSATHKHHTNGRF